MQSTTTRADVFIHRRLGPDEINLYNDRICCTAVRLTHAGLHQMRGVHAQAWRAAKRRLRRWKTGPENALCH